MTPTVICPDGGTPWARTAGAKNVVAAAPAAVVVRKRRRLTVSDMARAPAGIGSISELLSAGYPPLWHQSSWMDGQLPFADVRVRITRRISCVRFAASGHRPQ